MKDSWGNLTHDVRRESIRATLKGLSKRVTEPSVRMKK